METFGVAGAQPAGTTRSCVGCGRSIPWEANVCPYCGHDYRIPTGVVAPPRKSLAPVAAGILLVIAGIAAIAMGMFYFSLDAQDLETAGIVLPSDMEWEDIEGALDVCGALAIVFGLIAVLGGVMSARRKYLTLSILGGVFGILGMGFLIGALLAFIGLVLLIVSRKEFS